jgi:hypothetical protein
MVASLQPLPLPALSSLEPPQAAARECLALAVQCQTPFYKKESVAKVLQESDRLLPCPCLTKGIDLHSHARRLDPFLGAHQGHQSSVSGEDWRLQGKRYTCKENVMYDIMYDIIKYGLKMYDIIENNDIIYDIMKNVNDIIIKII